MDTQTTKFLESRRERDSKIVGLRAAGLTMQAIADKLHISKQRVSVILAKRGAAK